MEANNIYPDQTAPNGAVWSGFILFAIREQSDQDSKATYEHKQIRRVDDKSLDWQEMG